MSRQQLLDAGLSRSVVDTRVRRAVLVRLWPTGPAVYRYGHRFLAPLGRLFAAVHVTGGLTSVICGRSAAAFWELCKDRGPIDVNAPGNKGRGLRGVQPHHFALLRSDWRGVDGLRVTTPMRSVFDVGAELPAEQLLRVLERAELLQLIDVAELRALMRRHPRRAGVPKLRAALEAYDPDLVWLRSELERIIALVCKELGHPLPSTNVHYMGRERDFLWRNPMLVVEADGRTHFTVEGRERDTQRDNELSLHGIPHLRFTYRQAKSGYAERTLRRCLADRLLSVQRKAA